MPKKIYSVPAKTVAALLLLISFIGAGFGGFHAVLAAFAGCYENDLNGDYSESQSSFYHNSLCWNAVNEYVNQAEAWYQLSRRQDDLSYSEREHFQYLTDTLKQSSLYAVRISEGKTENQQLPIAGKTTQDSFVKFTYYPITETGNHETGYEIYIDEDSGINDVFAQMRVLYQEVFPGRWSSLVLAAVSAFIGLVCWIFLLIVAGRSATTGEIVLKGFHRIPFDLITLLFVFAGCMLCITFDPPYWAEYTAFLRMYAALAVIAVLAIVMLVMLWTHTLAARIKGHMLLRSTILGMLGIKIWDILRKSARGLTEAGKKAKAKSTQATSPNNEDPGKNGSNVWSKTREYLGRIDWRHNRATAAVAAVGRGICAAIRHLAELFRNLNVIWKLCGIITVLTLALEWLAMGAAYDSGVLMCLVLLDLLVFLAVGFFALQLDRLKKGGERLAEGDLDYKIPTDHMYWDLQQHAKNLNAISDGMAVAVEERLKSERMKYELLTNVSHDIKTPLTSIINYVDLLRGEPIEGEHAQEYIEVLERQSAKLKKLITDLIEVSKATTGNITVHAERTHAGELLRQCVGEYSERFAAQNLEFILAVPDDEPSIYADGRLLWRIFDNLLGNIVKYALPGTRVYIDLECRENKVVISLKNISRERLSISSDELMERFVRGDASRATEGSGLGLSIARSLTELMHGQFGLMVDGDLFKIILNFNRMEDIS